MYENNCVYSQNKIITKRGVDNVIMAGSWHSVLDIQVLHSHIHTHVHTLQTVDIKDL